MVEIEKEITVRLKWNLDETKVSFVNKGIPLVESFVLKDIYLVRDDVNVEKTKKKIDTEMSNLIKKAMEGKK